MRIRKRRDDARAPTAFVPREIYARRYAAVVPVVAALAFASCGQAASVAVMGFEGGTDAAIEGGRDGPISGVADVGFDAGTDAFDQQVIALAVTGFDGSDG